MADKPTVFYECCNETIHWVGEHELRSLDDGRGTRKWWIDGRETTEEKFRKALKINEPWN
jgi:hypothetical protein